VDGGNDAQTATTFDRHGRVLASSMVGGYPQREETTHPIRRGPVGRQPGVAVVTKEKGVGFFWVMGSGYAPLVSDSDVRIMSLEVKLVDIRNFNIGRFDSVLSLRCVCE